MELQNVEHSHRKRKLRIPKRDKPLQRVAWLEALFDGLPEAVILVDRGGRVIYCNPATLGFLGKQPESIEPEAWGETYGLFLDEGNVFYPPQKLPHVRALNGEHVESEEMFLMPANKPGIWVTMTAQPLSQTVEGIEGAMVMLRDVSLRKQAEQSREKYFGRIEALYGFTRELAEMGLELDLIVNALVSHASVEIGDACVVTMWKDGKLKNVAADHRIPEARELFRGIALARENIDGQFVAKVIETAEPFLLPNLPPEAEQAFSSSAYAEYFKAYGIRSIMIIPLKGRHGVVGVMSLSRNSGRPAYTEGDQSFAVDIAYRASLAIENCKLFGSLLEEMQERISAKQAQEETEERLRSIFDSTAMGIKVLNMDGKIVQTNPALQEMLGYESTEIFGRHFTELIHKRDISRSFTHFDMIRNSVRDLRFEHRLLHKNNEIVWVNTTLTAVKRNPTDEYPAFVVGIVDNITERKKIELELIEMKSRFQEGVEKERLRLAQDLHDGPMQDLHSATYLLATLEGLQPSSSDKITNVTQIIQEVISGLRATARELRPPSLIDFGLEQAIVSHLSDMQEKYPAIKFQAMLDEDQKLLTEEIRLAFFRVYQNAIVNTIRHAEAKNVSVHLSLDAEEVRMVIEDDGKGFVVPPRWIALMRKGHFGLAGAAERIGALGGTFQVQSEPNKGTRIMVQLTLPSPDELNDVNDVNNEKMDGVS